ncbi:O-antigen ligase family protein [Hahella aquimaris]|uniref:O-antigen ligase family protein n=1 Tax=Hahella sp. HNIBRBA332 TaxID=3015983 RepID=UPI00273B3759|nr:O-antigen ligase family protein [Hahella sp. HNIBRBA332]WLQ16644.1 O-antigen ligase family protein [Hahella sp. HNIBRBA332]
MQALSRHNQLTLGAGGAALLSLGFYFSPHPLLAGLAPLGILAAVGVFRAPFLVCLGFILFSFFRLHEAFPALGPFRIPQLLALASLAVLSWRLFVSRAIEVYWSRELTLFAFFFGLTACGVMLATNRGAAMGAFTGTYVKIAIMVLAIAWLTRTPRDFSVAAWAFIGAGVAIALVAISNKLNGIGLVEGARVTIGRDIGSMIGDPNDLALVLTFPLSFAASMVLTQGQTRWRMLLGLLAYGVIVWAILCTQSRGGLLGITAVAGVLVWRRVRNKMLVMMLGGIALMVLVAAAGISDRASGGAAEEGIDESAMGRIYAWQAAFNMALAHPFTGVGIDNFYSNYYFYSPHWDGKNHAVHSTWFQVLAETGFVGLGFFVVLLVGMFRKIFSLLRRLSYSPTPDRTQLMIANALLSGLTGFCVSGTFLTQGFIWPLYILLALTVAAGRAAERAQSSDAQG